MNDDSKPPDYAAVIGLVFAFLPSVFLLMGGGRGSGFSHGNGKTFWAICLWCVGVCFISSFLMFKGKTVWAIVAGIILLLLNLGIAFLFGCAAVVFP